MQIQEIIGKLEKEWELETGFFGLLRSGTFDQERADKLISLLQTLASQNNTSGLLDRRLVELTWFIPVFMSWQRWQIEQAGGDLGEFDSTLDAVVSLLHRILGVP